MPTPHRFSQSQPSASSGQNCLRKLQRRRSFPTQPGCDRGTASLAPCPAQVRLAEISPAAPATFGGHSSPPAAPAELQAASPGCPPSPRHPAPPASRTDPWAGAAGRAGTAQAITWRPGPAPLAATRPVAALAGCGWSQSCGACTGPESMLRFV